MLQVAAAVAKLKGASINQVCNQEKYFHMFMIVQNGHKPTTYTFLNLGAPGQLEKCVRSLQSGFGDNLRRS